jgi:hypothetical protein
MKRRRVKENSFVVTREAIEDFRRLSAAQRLQWLDEARWFISQVRAARRK